MCLRHEADCGSIFSCVTCQEKFRTKNAHYKHAVRKKHALPEGAKPKKKANSSPKTSTVLKPPTIIVKNVIQLPQHISKTAQTSLTGVPKSVPQKHSTAVQVNLWKSVIGKLIEASSTSSQTNDSDWSSPSRHHYDNNQLVTSSEKSSISVGTAPISTLSEVTQENSQFSLELSDLATQTEGYYSPQHFNLSDFATQTDALYTVPIHDPTQHQHHFSLSDLATQTNEDEINHFVNSTSLSEQPKVTLINTSTCTPSSSISPSLHHSQAIQTQHHFSLSDLATQTNEEDIMSNFVNSTGLSEPSSMMTHIDHSTCTPSSSHSSSHSQAIQTLSQPTNEFGTQTLCHLFQADFSHFQSSPSSSSAPSIPSHSCSAGLHHHRVDTTTHSHHSYTHQELSDDSVVDFGTQTTLPFPLGCSTVNDFGTQTISDQELSDLVHELSSEGLQQILSPECMDFGTQTLESEFAGIECLDFGVQTSFSLQFSSDHQDQSSQTQD